ncbi:MAG: hypothetical protein OCD01_09090 [Fibrobacterales bacterium]
MKTYLNYSCLSACIWAVSGSIIHASIAIKVLGVALFVGLTLFEQRGMVRFATLKHPYVILIGVFSFIGIMTGLYNEQLTGKLSAYALLFFVLIAYNSKSEEQQQHAKLGLLLGGGIYFLVLLAEIEYGQLLSGIYRLGGEQNPNAVAYVGGMVAIGALVSFNSGKVKTVFVLVGLLIIAATKSKTGLGVFFMGLIVYLGQILLFRKHVVVNRPVRIMLAMIPVVAVLFLSQYYDLIVKSYQLDSHRGLEGGTGRFEAWEMFIQSYEEGDVWQLLFGKGVGANSMLGEGHGYSSAHNAWLVLLFDLGLLPLIGLTLLFSNLFYQGLAHPYFPVIIAMTIESMAEINFIGVGNIGSIIASFCIMDMMNERRKAVHNKRLAVVSY